MSRVNVLVSRARQRLLWAAGWVFASVVALKLRAPGVVLRRTAVVTLATAISLWSGLATFAINVHQSLWAALALAVTNSVMTAMLIVGIVDKLKRP